MSVLTVVDVSGIQKYIFGSNRLKEIIGASEIVNQATNKDGWIKGLLNSNDELIYAGGGNALIIFADIDRAKEFTRKYTHQILTEARGLEVVIAHSSDFAIDDPTLTILERRDEVFFDKLSEKKANRQTSSPLLGLAVTAQCVSTGGVASFFDKDRKKYVSEESRLKLKMVTNANENLIKRLGLEEVTDGERPDIPLDFDNLGRTQGESSFIAVVHTDGNGMGKRVIEAGKGKDNRECIDKMRLFSELIETANWQALQKAVRLLLRHIDSGNKTFTDKYGESFDLIINDKGNACFPFRPLIFGGDDLTFVCDGRIALALTAFYLKELAKIKLSDDKPPIYGRAGISIVKTHYPFSRAYQLAEELAANAKEIINEVDQNEKQVVAMNWHVAMSGLLGDLGEIRQREYTVPEGKLNMRPVLVSSANQYTKWRTWGNFESVLTDFQGHSASKENWREKRNKVKLLREILRKGSNETRSFIENVQKLPSVVNGSDIEKSGWDGKRGKATCGYFDAIEMMDLFYQLDETKLGGQTK